MKVAFFIGGLNRGGTETLVLDTFRKKESTPFDSILIYRNEGDLSDAYRSTGIKMIRIKPGRLKLGYIHHLRKVLKQERVDILHTQTLLNAFLGLFCVLFSHVKLVASFHGFRSSFVGRLLTHPVMWLADASVFVSDFERQWYLRKTLFAPEKRCHVIYNGIDFSKFSQSHSRPDFLESCNLDSPSPYVNLAMIGNFVSVRSHFFLCQGLKRLLDDGVGSFQFFFVGKRSEAEPEKYDDCFRFCEENRMLEKVHFIGGRGDVPAILQYINGFVYSSHRDTFGIAVVEALAAGVPVVVNDWGVMREITDLGKMACLYKTEDIDDFVKKMKAFLEGISAYKLQAQKNAAIVQDKFSIERHIDNLYLLYKALLEPFAQ